MTHYIALNVLSTASELEERRIACRQTAILRHERPQSDFKGGWIRQWTILNPWYDRNGYNRQYSTFSIWGLAEIGVIKIGGIKHGSS